MADPERPTPLYAEYQGKRFELDSDELIKLIDGLDYDERCKIALVRSDGSHVFPPGKFTRYQNL